MKLFGFLLLGLAQAPAGSIAFSVDLPLQIQDQS